MSEIKERFCAMITVTLLYSSGWCLATDALYTGLFTGIAGIGMVVGYATLIRELKEELCRSRDPEERNE